METIIYQGQSIKATLVNYLSGAIPTSTVEHDGDEDLFRDEAGRYYLRRQLSRLDSEGECRPASGRTHIHRIGVNAAILWATTRPNSETLDLRDTARNLLKHGAPRSHNRHAVTIHLTPTQLRMFMQVADDDGTGSMADVVLRELGQHVALHLECYHSHRLEAARQRWNQEGKEVASR